MVYKKGLYVPLGKSLTKTEKEILHLISDEFLTPKQIILRRKTSPQAFYKIRRRLIHKGYLNLVNQDPTRQPVNLLVNQKNKIRLHGEEFNIKILWQDHRYQSKFKKSNVQYIDGNTIRLYKKSIEIYSGQSFLGDTAQSATAKSIEYWKRFLTRLEHDLIIIIIKNKAHNIKQVNSHYASTNSKICENAIENNRRVRVFDNKDGKLAFITDDSFGLKEDETVHPTTAYDDRERIDKQINDWRNKNPPTNSELTTLLMQIAQSQLKTQEQMTEIAKKVNGNL